MLFSIKLLIQRKKPISIEVLVFMLRVPKVGYFDEKSAKLCGQRSGIRGRMRRHITDLGILAIENN